MPIPAAPKIYHVVHVDRLSSVIAAGGLPCDAEIDRRRTAGQSMGTAIGMSGIKQRRLTQPGLESHPGLSVGQCVLFHFCPWSVMLYLIHRANLENLTYRGGQEPIVHLEADLFDTVAWANSNAHRWAFTRSNAGAFYFEDHADLTQLGEIDWDAVQARDWSGRKEGKQAEFLLERSFPWELVSRIGVRSQRICGQVSALLKKGTRRTHVEIRPDWYY